MTVESKLLPGGGNMLVATGGGHVLAPPQNVSPGYDANGNVTGDGLWNYTWDGENRLVGVETVSAVPETGQRKIEYAYDFEGRRIQTIRYTKSGANWVTDPAGPTVMLYDGWNLIAERNSTADKKYLWGPDLSGTFGQAGGVGGLLAIHNAGQTDSVAYDANGNVAALVNASSGAVDGSYEYGPFGEPLAVTGPIAQVNPFRFSTKYTDNESRLIYYGYRFYNPVTGKWSNRDPIGEKGGVNLYSMLNNNILADVDFLGMLSWKNLPTVWGTMPDGQFTDKGARALGKSTPTIKVNAKCDKCNKLKELLVEFRVNTLIIGSFSSDAQKAFIYNGERQHQDDYYAWANSTGRNLGGQLEERQKKDVYASEAECVKENRNKAKTLLMESLSAAVSASGQRWDDNGLHTWHGQ